MQERDEPDENEVGHEVDEQQLLDRDVVAARRLFIAGFFLLPFVWLLNVLYYRKATSPLLQQCRSARGCFD
jgi:hypothetical protein